MIRSHVAPLVVLLTLSACGKDSSAASTQNGPVVAAIGAAAHVDGNHFKLDGAPAGDCSAGATCTVAIRLEALAAYHINKDYPYKFKAQDVSGVEFLGTDPAGKNVFSKGAGDFAVDGEKTATMNVRFKPSARGPVTVTGTYKLSVCSADNCQLEQQEMAIAATVK